MKRHSISTRSRKRGFVLILTLAMILLAVMLTARTANRSLSRTLQSLDAESQLRQRWETLSLQRALFLHAGMTFHKVDDQYAAMPLWVDGRFHLAGRTYRVRLSDESSKLNLNTLRQVLAPEQSQQTLSDLVSGWSSRSAIPRRLESWGQLFGNRPPVEIINATTSITCWGDGRLNIERASSDSIRQLLEPIIGSSEVAALQRLQQERNLQPLRQHRALAVPTIAQHLVTDTSHCYSLWIVEQDSGTTRFDVREWDGQTHRLTTFRW